MSGTTIVAQTDSPTAPGTGKTSLSFPATSTNQLKWVDGDGGTNTIDGGGFTLTIPATGTAALRSDKLSAFAATTSTELAGVISDETGSGALVFATSPAFTTPTLGIATATSINKVTLTAPATGSTLTIADGKTLTVNDSLTLAGGAYTLTVPATGTAALLGTANVFTVGQTIAATLSSTLLTLNQSGTGDIATYKDAGVSRVRVPDQGGIVTVPQAGGFQVITGLIGYDNSAAGFKRLKFQHEDHTGPVPIDPRNGFRQVLVVTSYP